MKLLRVSGRLERPCRTILELVRRAGAFGFYQLANGDVGVPHYRGMELRVRWFRPSAEGYVEIPTPLRAAEATYFSLSGDLTADSWLG